MAAELFWVFSKLNIRNNSLINRQAKSGFTVFLLQHAFFGLFRTPTYVVREPRVSSAHVVDLRCQLSFVLMRRAGLPAHDRFDGREAGKTPESKK